MDQLASMRTFRRVVEAGSFTAAARQLNLSKAAVSKQISDLEAYLGAALLNRTTRRLSPTEAGGAYFESCVRLLDEIDEAESEVRHLQAEPSGTLRISAPDVFGQAHLGPIVAEMAKLYPKLTVVYQLTDRFVDLIEEGVDAAVRIRTGLPDSSLVARRICDIQRVVCAAPSYLKAHGTPKTPEDLKNHNCLINTLSSAPFDWDFHTSHGRRVVKVHGIAQASNANILLASLLAGIGIAHSPVFIVGPDLAAKRLVPILTRFPIDAHQLYVVYPQNRHLSPKVRVFIDLLIERFGRDQPWERCPDPSRV